MSDDNIDRIAFIFFSALTFCALMNDSYSFIHNFFKNDYVKKKVNNINKIKKVFFGLLCNNYNNDEEGNIIIEESNQNDTILKNPFDDCDEDYDNYDDEEIINMYLNENNEEKIISEIQENLDEKKELVEEKLDESDILSEDEELIEENSDKSEVLIQENLENDLKIYCAENVKILKENKEDEKEDTKKDEKEDTKEDEENTKEDNNDEIINHEDYEKNMEYDNITILKKPKKNNKKEENKENNKETNKEINKENKKKKEKIIKEIIIKKPNKNKKDEN